MTANHIERASCTDRDAVMDILREAYATERLAPDEFEERMAAAFHAKTIKDLEPLTTDLKTIPAGSKGLITRETHELLLAQQAARLHRQITEQSRNARFILVFLLGMVIFLSLQHIFGWH